MRTSRLMLLIGAAFALTVSLPAAQQAPPAPTPAPSNPRTDQFKRDVGLEVDAMGENIQKMNDMRDSETTRILHESLAVAKAELRQIDVGQSLSFDGAGCELPPPVLVIEAWQPWKSRIPNDPAILCYTLTVPR